MSAYHAAVLRREVVEWLAPERGGVFFDGTLGGGGHSEAILEAGEAARVVASDRDPAAIEEASRRLSRYGDRLEVRAGDYAEVAEGLEGGLAGALLDLGVSSHQIDAAERGFSFRAGSPLDMRMGGEATGGPTAADVLNGYAQEALASLFRRFGEEPRSRAIARRVVERRETQPFRTSDDLNEVLESVYGHRLTPQDRARIYQALRIEVNRELESLERALPVVRERLGPAGVLVVIAYHSLEDRVVKHSFREWSRACICPPELPVCVCRGAPLGETLTRKPVRPSAREVEENPRSRSARLRAWRKAA